MRRKSLLQTLWVPILCLAIFAAAALPGTGTGTAASRSHHIYKHLLHRRHYRYRYRYHHRYRHIHRRSMLRGPHLRSSEALVIDTAHSKVLYARRASVAQPIASISKLMTAMVVLDAKQPLDQVLQITPADRAIGRGAFDRLRIGTRLTRAKLLHIALMSSDNRAAHALGRNYPGGLRAFVRAMNAKARTLGMRTAHFVEPTGLSSHNVASPDDLAKMVAAAARYPLIRRYSTAHHLSVWVGSRRTGLRRIEFNTTDPLVASRAWRIIVQKTGFIDPAGHCLVLQTVIDHRTVVMVLLHAWGKYTQAADARRVRRWLEARRTERLVRAGRSTA